jgi:hypothetical protein
MDILCPSVVIKLFCVWSEIFWARLDAERFEPPLLDLWFVLVSILSANYAPA